MALPTYKDIVELIKKGATVEAQEKIMELREAILGLQEENHSLKEKVRELEEHLKIKGALKFEHGVYLKGDDRIREGPFCQRCFDVEQKLIRLQDEESDWHCLACDKWYRKSDHIR